MPAGAILLANLVLLGLVSTAAPAQANHARLCDPIFDWAVTHGTPGDDTIIGAPWDWDCVAAKAGDDTVKGGTGEDAILGGAGADLLLGQEERDAINGQGGHDIVKGGPGTDRLYGGPGQDIVRGGDGADNIFGGGFCEETSYWGFLNYELYPDVQPTNPCSIDGGDVLRGGPGNDWIWESNSDHKSDGAVDVIFGGPGYDICVVGPEDLYTGCEKVVVLDGV